MNRKLLLFRGIGIGYLSMAAGMAYSFLSIPLALAYLGKSEYGLWSLVMTVTGYLNFTELGVSNSITRHLIDFKEVRPNRSFGAVFLAGAMSFGAIGMLSIIIGLVFVSFLPQFVGIPVAQADTFKWLLTGTTILFGLTLMTRILGAPLYVYQRFDVYEAGNIVLFGIWLGTLYAALRLGYGIYSLLISQGAGWVFSTIYNLISCSFLRIYPKVEEWSLPNRTMIREIALFSRDSFLQQIGEQVVASLPVLIITRTLGLDATANWTVGVRPFYILHQFLRRPFQYGSTMLSDTYANQGVGQTINLWIKIAKMTTLVSMVLYPTCVFLNAEFMRLWTHGKILWSFPEAALCGIYFLLISVFNSYYGMVGINKRIGIVRFSSLSEGLLIVACTIFLCPRFGLMGLIIALLISKIVMGILPVLLYLKEVFGGDIKNVIKKSVVCPLRILPITCLIAWLMTFLVNEKSGWWMLILTGFFSLVFSTLIAVLFGGGYNDMRSIIGIISSRKKSRTE